MILNCNGYEVYAKEIHIRPGRNLGHSIVGGNDLFDLGFRAEELDRYGLKIGPPAPKPYVWPKCSQCGEDCKDGYMLTKEVWDSIAKPKDFLHIICAEVRLGRKIRIEDFSDWPINNITKLLLKRMAE